MSTQDGSSDVTRMNSAEGQSSDVTPVENHSADPVGVADSVDLAAAVAARRARYDDIMSRRYEHGPLVTFFPIKCRSGCPEGWPCASHKRATADLDTYLAERQ